MGNRCIAGHVRTDRARGGRGKHRREIGFWVFLTSNVLWVIWGVYAEAWALIVLQVALAGMNIRGMVKNRD